MLAMDGIKPYHAILTGVDAHGEVHVEKDDIHMFLLHDGQDAVGRRQSDDAFKHTTKTYPHCCENSRIVVNDEQCAIV